MSEKEKVKCFICGYNEATLLLQCDSTMPHIKRVKCSVCGTYEIDREDMNKDIDTLITEAISELSGYNKGGVCNKSDIDAKDAKFMALYNRKSELKALLRYYVKKNSATSEYDTNILRVDSGLCMKLFEEHFPNPTKNK
jgi:hypothetical protein